VNLSTDDALDQADWHVLDTADEIRLELSGRTREWIGLGRELGIQRVLRDSLERCGGTYGLASMCCHGKLNLGTLIKRED
jgi:hypothetical protein